MTAPCDLDAIEARTAAATPGPWTAQGYPYIAGPMKDRRFIAHARTDVPAMAREIRSLRANALALVGACEIGRIALEKAQAEAGRYRDVLEQALVDLSLLVDPPCGVLDMVEAALAKKGDIK